MAKLESNFIDIGALDRLAMASSPVHRLDPRAKLVTTLLFVVTVVSFGKYQVSALLPFFLFPVALAMTAGLPAAILIKRLLLVAPFALLVGIFNPILDREVAMQVGPLALSGGWLSFFSILLRFTLTVLAALVLLATTGFTAVCMAAERLGTPRAFVLQLLFLHRYLFVLIEEALRMVRARALRSFHGRGLGMRVFGHLVGQLLLRTIGRAQRIHMAMLCRGFDGDLRMLRGLGIGRREVVFTLAWSLFFLTCRLVNLPQTFGTLLTEIIR